MGQEPTELRADIERRREDLGETIDAIGDRVSPGRIMERRKNRMADGIRSLRERVMGSVGNSTHKVGDAAGSVREHISADVVKDQTAGSPLGAGLVAFGFGFLVAVAIPPSEPEVEAAQRAQQGQEHAKDALLEAGHSIADDLRQDAALAAQQVKEHATEAVSNVGERAKEQAAATREQASPITQ